MQKHLSQRLDRWKVRELETVVIILIMEDLVRLEDVSEELNCCLFAVSKMYVCTTNKSCLSLQSRFRATVKPSEVGLIKLYLYGRR
jgi:hypothetical protein